MTVLMAWTIRFCWSMSLTAADADKGAMDGAIKGLKGWIACFEKARLAGTVFGGGADALGTIQGNPALKDACEMGRNV